MEIYRIDGRPVFLPRLLLGILMTLFLGVLNYRGIRGSATFQGWATTIVLVLFALVATGSAAHGSLVNFHPGFHAAPLVSILLVLQIVPYFLTGFESVPKAAEEAHQEFRSQGFFRAIVCAIHSACSGLPFCSRASTRRTPACRRATSIRPRPRAIRSTSGSSCRPAVPPAREFRPSS